MDRRTLLRRLILAGAGGALAACSSTTSSGSAEPSPSNPDPSREALERISGTTEPTLAVVAATFEQLVGQPHPFAFGLFTPEQEPVEIAGVELHAVLPSGATAGPWKAEQHSIDAPPGALLVAPVEFGEEGVHELVAVSDDGRAGTVAVDVRQPSSSQLIAPGQQAIEVATPTAEDALGYEQICTLTPEPCGMHEISLDEALADGRPVALTFATPAFCQTAVCAPSVEILDAIRTARDWGDLAFIHCEIYSDAGETLGEPVAAWGLPTEPWLFVIDGDGEIVERVDGPLLALADQVEQVLGTAETA